MAYGRLCVDFVGTRYEAREFVRTVKSRYKFSVAHGGGNEGPPQLSVIYSGREMELGVLAQLLEWGWAEGSMSNHHYVYPRRAVSRG